MKKLIFISALMIGTAAIAQDATQDDMTTDTETTTTTTTDTGMAQTTTTTTNADMSMQGGGGTVAPSNANPEEDARGITVISAPAEAPAGANQPVSAPPGAQIVPSQNQAAVFQTRQGAQEYPACTRTVTDNCVQTYERGRAR